MRTLSSWLTLGVAAIAIGVAQSCAPQERFSGRAKITDGDSFEIGAIAVRLYGIDAPEGRQSCTRDGREWACGDAAARELRRLTGSATITCVQRDVDDYGRVVAQCRNGSTDLGAEMVRAGLATAYRRYSNDYVDEEREARAAKRGIWVGEFTPPEEYRRNEQPVERSDTPQRSSRRDGCYIKGNVNDRGDKIYHTPDSPSYATTAIDESRGERWFCTTAEARREGWRAPGGR